jgi:cysteine synthase A
MAIDLFAAVGNTPLIELSRLSSRLGRTILGKAEFQNPGGSVKDRAARAIIIEGEATGRLRPGGVIVEGTAGNTGIALALLGRAHGLRTLLVVPANQSDDKFVLLRSLGVEVRKVPPVPFADERNYYHVARQLAAQIPGAMFADQFENRANRRAHMESTGPEIWLDTFGKLAAFTCATGTGGTFAGVAAFLKSQNPAVRCVLADPMGSSLYAYVTDGSLDTEGDSMLEGIGIRRVTANFRNCPVDEALRVTDADAVSMAHWLLHEEGLFLGGSAALNVLAAARVALTLPRGSIVVTILCDSGARYQSRLYNAEWLRAHGYVTGPIDLDLILRESE